MFVDLMLYFYLFVCLMMIAFNLACLFLFRHQDVMLHRHSRRFQSIVKEQIQEFPVSEKHKTFLLGKLSHLRYLMAFDEMLDEMKQIDPEHTAVYLEQITPVFMYLTRIYGRRDKLQSAYYPYLIKKHALFRGKSPSMVSDTLLQLVHSKNLYCRENALQALYSMGNCNDMIRALHVLNANPAYHSHQVLTDGLLQFEGDAHQLSLHLWESLDQFRPEYQLAILNYFRFQSGEWRPQMLELLAHKKLSNDLLLSCLRYFRKYPYPPARPYLLQLAGLDNEVQWEIIAIACTALAAYPGDDTITLLKRNLHSRNWYIRYNSADSLEAMGMGYLELIDILEGPDRYASEILRYRLEEKRLENHIPRPQTVTAKKEEPIPV